MLLQNYTFILMMTILCLVVPAVGLLIAKLLGPKRPNRIKNSTYECGMETIGDAWVQFKAQYYLFALIFVIFDIEAVFLFPFALAYYRINQFALAMYALVETVLFVGILLAGLLYAWRKGALEWQ